MSERWYHDHKNLADLWRWLEEIGETPADGPAYFMEKPWKWTDEFKRYTRTPEFVSHMNAKER